jgi:hypothetical protein
MEHKNGLILPGTELFEVVTKDTRAKGLAPWDPDPDDVYGRIWADVQVVLERYRNHLPLGPHEIMYQLMPKWVEADEAKETGKHYKTKKQLDGAVSTVVGRARRAGKIPWESISDDRTEHSRPWEVTDLSDIVGAVQNERQVGQPYRTEIWIEAQSAIERVARIAKPYGITVYSGSGSVPIAACRQAAARHVVNDPWPTLILLIVDFDPAGQKNIRNPFVSDVRAFVRSFIGGDNDTLHIRQLAITEEQARALPEAVRTKIAERDDWPVDYKVELQAMPPDQFDRLIQDAVEANLDRAALAAALAAEPQARLDALVGLVEDLRD